MFPRRSGTLRGTKIRSYCTHLHAIGISSKSYQIIENYYQKAKHFMGSKWNEATVVASSTRSSFVISMARRSFISDDDPTVYSDLVSIGIP